MSCREMVVRRAALVVLLAATGAVTTRCAGPAQPEHREARERHVRESELRALQQQLAERPDDHELLTQVAWLHWVIGDLDAAERFFRQSVANGENIKAREALLSVLLTRGRYVGARELAVQLLDADGSSVPEWIRTVHRRFEQSKGTAIASTEIPLSAVDGRLQNSIGMRFVQVPKMSFVRGSDTGDADQRPAREIGVAPYFIGQYEVTQGQFKQFLDDTHYPFTALVPGFEDPGRAMYPAAAISWLDAEAFAMWLSNREHAVYRLPTEAEWELAARGPAGWHEPWGNDRGTKHVDGNWGRIGFSDLSATRRGLPPPISPVGSFPRDRSAFGVFDMAGNVREWCTDEYDATYYSWSPATNPFGPMERPGVRVLRGGSWNDPGSRDFAIARWHAAQNQPYTGYGVRLVREMPVAGSR